MALTRADESHKSVFLAHDKRNESRKIKREREREREREKERERRKTFWSVRSLWIVVDDAQQKK